MAEAMALKDMPEDVTHPDHPLFAMFGQPWEANAFRSWSKTFTKQGQDPMKEDGEETKTRNSTEA